MLNACFALIEKHRRRLFFQCLRSIGGNGWKLIMEKKYSSHLLELKGSWMMRKAGENWWCGENCLYFKLFTVSGSWVIVLLHHVISS